MFIRLKIVEICSPLQMPSVNIKICKPTPIHRNFRVDHEEAGTLTFKTCTGQIQGNSGYFTYFWGICQSKRIKMITIKVIFNVWQLHQYPNI